jgi:tetratricopeptide (TPR) repeat protein
MTTNWDALQAFADTLLNHPQGPGGVPALEWQLFAETLDTLQHANDHLGVIRLRRICRPLLARDSAWGIEVLRRIDDAAIVAAHTLNDAGELGHLYGARGHNLHREGKHALALQAFMQSVHSYEQIANSRAARKNTYMQALCYRALGEVETAKRIVHTLLDSMGDDDDWRDEPLFMMAKFAQDDGDYAQAEHYMRAAIGALNGHHTNSARHADLLANFAELIGLQARYSEATATFAQSMTILLRYPGQYDRLVARTLTKHAAILVAQGDYQQALKLLDRADDRISRYGRYYEQLWRIEMLRSAIYLRQGRLYVSWRKFNIARQYAHHYTDVSSKSPTQWLIRIWNLLSAYVTHRTRTNL